MQSTRVATSPFQSNSLRGRGEEQTTKKHAIKQRGPYLTYTYTQ